MQLKIKVCGITQLQQVHQLVKMGADYAGFIFYDKSPRFVAGKITPDALKNISGINKVGVFVNENYESILQLVSDYGLDGIQLHGDESTAFCKRLKEHTVVVKAIRLTGSEDLPSILQLYNDVVDYFLFDTGGKEYGGTGKKFDWSTLSRTKIAKPYFLSGGIGPLDADAIKIFLNDVQNKPYALDINSRFEIAAGVKDMGLVQEFIKQFH